MSLTLHSLRAPRGSSKRRKRLGRGLGSGHGAYSTRGIKGQRARQGGRKGLVQLGVKHFISHLPKTRGFKSLKARPQIITLQQLSRFKTGTVVTPALLLHEHLIDFDKQGTIKIIGVGKLGGKLTVKVHALTAGARAAIEKAGGSVELLSQVK